MKKTARKPAPKKAVIAKAKKTAVKKAAPKKANAKKVLAKKTSPKKKLVEVEASPTELTALEQAPILLAAMGGVKSQIADENSGENVVHPEGHRRRNLKESFNKSTQRMIAENNRAKNKPQIVNHSVRTSAKRG